MHSHDSKGGFGHWYIKRVLRQLGCKGVEGPKGKTTMGKWVRERSLGENSSTSLS